MTETESSILLERIAEREGLEDRISLIIGKCQLFKKGFDKKILNFRELRGACRFLSRLIGSLDEDVGDLCLLASHAETLAQFETICHVSCSRWRAEGCGDDEILSGRG